MSIPPLDLDALLLPVHPARPGGEDVSFDMIYTDIQEARRADDPDEAQGDWETEVKVADWARVVKLAGQVLVAQSKDLQVAMWLVEGWTHQHGLVGLDGGLTLLARFIDQFWDGFYPLLDDYGLEERIGRLEWFDRTLPAAALAVPVTARDHGGYTVRDWFAAKELEQLAARDPAAYDEALRRGRTPIDALDKAIAATGAEFYAKLHAQAGQVRTAFDELIGVVDRRLGSEAPSFTQSRAALDRIEDLATRLAQRFNLIDARADSAPAAATPANAALPVPAVAAAGPIASRADAVQRLREVAAFFRRTEPHSPAAYLADKAASWADLPLDQWLRQVVKDEGTLGHMQELLGIRNEG